MKALVTGGNGFIGGYTVDKLLKEGHEVTVFDRFNGNDFFAEHKKVNWWVGDIRDFTAVNEAVAVHDVVFHCAGVLGTSETINEPRPAIEVNILGSLNIFQACRNYEKKCVYITVGNYWMNNSYSISKTTAERFAWMFNQEHGTEISVVRALNAYGPGQKSKPVRKIMPNFVLPALRGEAITVYGDGSQIMDMIHVADVADVLVRAGTVEHGQYAQQPEKDQDTQFKFDAGTGRDTTVTEIAEIVIACAGSGSINYVPMRGGEPENSVVLGDPSTLAPLYDGKQPELTSLEDGVAETVEYYRSLV